MVLVFAFSRESCVESSRCYCVWISSWSQLVRWVYCMLWLLLQQLWAFFCRKMCPPVRQVWHREEIMIRNWSRMTLIVWVLLLMMKRMLFFAKLKKGSDMPPLPIPVELWRVQAGIEEDAGGSDGAWQHANVKRSKKIIIEIGNMRQKGISCCWQSPHSFNKVKKFPLSIFSFSPFICLRKHPISELKVGGLLLMVCYVCAVLFL